MNFTLRSNIKLTIKTSFYLIAASIIFGFVSQFTLNLFNITLNYISFKDYIHKDGIYYSIFSYAIVTPLLEELSFRLWLKYSKINIFISLLSTVVLLLKVNARLHVYLFALIALFSIVLMMESNKIQLSFLWKKYQKIIFSFSCFLFGVCHIFNFETNSTILLLSPIITLQQISMGVILAKVRIKNGIFYSILPHSIYNFLIILMESVK